MATASSSGSASSSRIREGTAAGAELFETAQQKEGYQKPLQLHGKGPGAEHNRSAAELFSDFFSCCSVRWMPRIAGLGGVSAAGLAEAVGFLQ